MLHVAFNGQTEQEVDEAIDALGLESIPFPEIHARTGKKTNLRLLKKQVLMAMHLRVSAQLLQLHSLEENCKLLIQVLHYVGRIKKDRKMSCPVDKDHVHEHNGQIKTTVFCNPRHFGGLRHRNLHKWSSNLKTEMRPP